MDSQRLSYLRLRFSTLPSVLLWVSMGAAGAFFLSVIEALLGWTAPQGDEMGKHRIQPRMSFSHGRARRDS